MLEITGSDAFISRINQALNRLAAQDRQYVDSLACNIYQSNDFTAAVFQRDIRIQDEHWQYPSLTFVASILVHEACHIEQWRSVSNELACFARQNEALKRMSAPQSEIDYIAGQDGTHVCAFYPNDQGC